MHAVIRKYDAKLLIHAGKISPRTMQQAFDWGMDLGLIAEILDG
jgi:hypothetical protein